MPAEYIDAGRADIPRTRLHRQWLAWRGRAIEPIIRRLLREQAFDDTLIPESGAVGSWWNRNNTAEVDLVGTDRPTVGRKITFIGSIKWRENAPFSTHDLQALLAHRELVPGANDKTPLVAVSRTGGEVPGVTIITPEKLLTPPPK